MKTLFSCLLFLFSFALFSQDSSLTSLIIQPDASTGQDAVVWTTKPDSNYNHHESFIAYTWTNSGSDANMRAFVKFNMDQIPSNAVIHSAFLSLYYNPTDMTQGIDVHSGNNNSYIERVTGTWLSNTITWNNQPISTTLNRLELASSANGTQDYVDMDVTQMVIDMLADSSGAEGFVLKMQDEDNPYKMLIFASSDNVNSSIHPKLVINYSTIPESCAVKFSNSDVYIEDLQKGVILTSPNGSCFRVQVQDDGSLTTILIDCPN